MGEQDGSLKYGPANVSPEDGSRLSRRSVVRRLGVSSALAAAGLVAISSPAAAETLSRTQPRRFRLAPPPVATDLGDLSDVNTTGAVAGEVLTFDGTVYSPQPPAGSSEVAIGRVVFTSSVTGYDWYAAYPSATRIVVEAVAGGGGGGGSSATANRGGGGGGAGGYIKLDLNLVHAAAAGVPVISQAASTGTQEEIWEEFDIVVGAGGAGGTGTSAGGSGGQSRVTFGRGHARLPKALFSYEPARIIAGLGSHGVLGNSFATTSNFSQTSEYSFNSGAPEAPSYWLDSYPVPLFDAKTGAAGGQPSNSPSGGTGGFAWPFNGVPGRGYNYYGGTGTSASVGDVKTLHGGHGGGGASTTNTTAFGGQAGARGSVQITFYGSA